jgi:hypothetical protein
MVQPVVNETLTTTESETGASGDSNPASLTLNGDAIAVPRDQHAYDDTLTKKVPATYAHPPSYFEEALADAERLLKYAAEMGIDIDADTRDYILQARAASGVGWSQETAANLLAALTKLAALLRPVTAESLKACHKTRPTVRTYWIVAICLGIIIVPFSLATFVSSAISNAIRTDITAGDDLAVKLRAQLGPPAVQDAKLTTGTPSKAASPLPPGLNEVDVITELQQFASTIRAIDARARQLNVLVFHAERDPFASYRNDPEKLHNEFQLPDGLPNLPEARDGRIPVYQDARYFAQSLLDDVSFFYGAISTCLLPVLYALLGTCAYLLRTFEKQMAVRTFMPSVANSARFLIAAIGGAVVGLFNNFTITQGASIPPLAIAFLVGYAVDVFFSFLEGLLQAFTNNKSSTNSPAPTPA